MRNLLLIALAAVTLAGCKKECPAGYGPDDCEVKYHTKFIGNWSGPCNCDGVNQTVLTQFREHTNPQKFYVYENIYAEIEDGGTSYTIPPQTANGVSYSGSGRVFSETLPGSFGSTLYLQHTFIVTNTATGQATECACNYNTRQ